MPWAIMAGPSQDCWLKRFDQLVVVGKTASRHFGTGWNGIGVVVMGYQESYPTIKSLREHDTMFENCCVWRFFRTREEIPEGYAWYPEQVIPPPILLAGGGYKIGEGFTDASGEPDIPIMHLRGNVYYARQLSLP